ncbi:TPA: alveolysin, partial [Bacillus toyonensis]|nr:alveolysin [Bacillus toyonensis]
MIFLKIKKSNKKIKFLACVLVSLCTIHYSSISFAETQTGNATDAAKNASDIN